MEPVLAISVVLIMAAHWSLVRLVQTELDSEGEGAQSYGTNSR
jgi:hypothetical protein